MTSLKQKLGQARREAGHSSPLTDILDSILSDLSRPFDPTECGFQYMAPHSEGLWESDGFQIVRLSMGLMEIYDEYDERNVDAADEYSRICKCPWPANHFDGVRLLLSLGVIKEGE